VDTHTDGGWQITLMSITETGTGWYDWYYEVRQTSQPSSKGLNFLAMLIPDCCTEPSIEVNLGHPENNLFKNYFTVAQGEPTVNFGQYNEGARVAKGTPDRAIEWHLITNTRVKTESTIILKVKRVGVLTFEMAVPGCQPETPIIASTKISFTAEDLLGNRYLIEIQKNQAGDILEIWRTNLQTNVSENITNVGISWDQIQFRYPDGSPDGYTEDEPVKFFPDDTTTKTGDASTCGYWYRGVFWNFCPPPP